MNIRNQYLSRKIPFQFTLMIVSVALSLLMVHPAIAQEADLPAIRITGANVDNFPAASVSVYSENLGVDFSSLSLSLSKDGQELEITDIQQVKVGVQIAIAIDTSTSLTSSGQSEDPQGLVLANTVARLINVGELSSETDWLGILAEDPESQELAPISAWSQDHASSVNTLLQYPFGEQGGTKSLYELLQFTLSSFESSTAGADVQKSIVLFSNGTDLISTGEVRDVIQRATDLNLRIFTVMIGKETAITRRNLERIAIESNGMYLVLRSAADLDSLWSMIGRQRIQHNIAFQLDNAQQGMIKLTASLPTGIELTSAIRSAAPDIQPMQVEISSPQSYEIVERQAIAFDTPLTELEPKILPIELKFIWPDGPPRQIDRVEYIVNDNVQVREEPPFDKYLFPIENLDEGVHTIRINAIDELGVVSSIFPVSIQVRVLRPTESIVVQPSAQEVMPATPLTVQENASIESATAATNETSRSIGGLKFFGLQLPATVTIFGTTFYVNSITMSIALIPMIFALLLLITWLVQKFSTSGVPESTNYEPQDHNYYEFDNASNPFPNVYAGQTSDYQATPSETEDEMTMPVRLPSFYTTAPAYLVYVSGGTHLPTKIPVESHEPVRIGRKRSFCEQVINDRRVSRLHATITAVDGNFYIKDEGSSGGTFVNRQKLGTVDNRLLMHNDVINLNEVEYRFEISELSAAAHQLTDNLSTHSSQVATFGNE